MSQQERTILLAEKLSLNINIISTKTILDQVAQFDNQLAKIELERNKPNPNQQEISNLESQLIEPGNLELAQQFGYASPIEQKAIIPENILKNAEDIHDEMMTDFLASEPHKLPIEEMNRLFSIDLKEAITQFGEVLEKHIGTNEEAFERRKAITKIAYDKFDNDDKTEANSQIRRIGGKMIELVDEETRQQLTTLNVSNPALTHISINYHQGIDSDTSQEITNAMRNTFDAAGEFMDTGEVETHSTYNPNYNGLTKSIAQRELSHAKSIENLTFYENSIQLGKREHPEQTDDIQADKRPRLDDRPRGGREG